MNRKKGGLSGGSESLFKRKLLRLKGELQATV